LSHGHYQPALVTSDNHGQEGCSPQTLT
jgi:hypothetical protein